LALHTAKEEESKGPTIRSLKCFK